MLFVLYIVFHSQKKNPTGFLSPYVFLSMCFQDFTFRKHSKIYDSFPSQFI